MNPYVGRALGAVAAILGIVAIWVELAPGGTTYWDGAGHAVGIAMLVLAIVAGIGIVLASITNVRAVDHVWPLPGLVLGGIAVFVPLSALGSGAIDELRTGGWLGVASCGLFLLAGVLAAVPEAARPAQPAPYVSASAAVTAPASAPPAEPAAEPGDSVD